MEHVYLVVGGNGYDETWVNSVHASLSGAQVEAHRQNGDAVGDGVWFDVEKWEVKP